MGCRAQFWSLVGAIALLWTCGGLFYAVASSQSIGQSAVATLTANSGPLDSQTLATMQNSATTGAMGANLGLFFCTGLPVLIVAALLANGAKRDHQYKQQLTLQQQQTVAMQQMAAQNTALQQRAYQPAPAPMTDVRPQFEAAKELIKAKQYDAARNLLKTINHPTATEWLAKLDKMS